MRTGVSRQTGVRPYILHTMVAHKIVFRQATQLGCGSRGECTSCGQCLQRAKKKSRRAVQDLFRLITSGNPFLRAVCKLLFEIPQIDPFFEPRPLARDPPHLSLGRIFLIPKTPLDRKNLATRSVGKRLPTSRAASCSRNQVFGPLPSLTASSGFDNASGGGLG